MKTTKVPLYLIFVLAFGCLLSLSSTRCFAQNNQCPKAAFTFAKTQCVGQPVDFKNTSSIENSEPLRFSWIMSDGFTTLDTHVKRIFISPGDYTIKLIARASNECVDSVKHTLKIIQACGHFVPTAFTPNKDGKNDIFQPVLPREESLKRFTIYNRYGNIVFETQTIGKGWDGTYKGTVLQTGVFIWLLEYISTDNKPAVEKGTVTLIR